MWQLGVASGLGRGQELAARLTPSSFTDNHVVDGEKGLLLKVSSDLHVHTTSLIHLLPYFF